MNLSAIVKAPSVDWSSVREMSDPAAAATLDARIRLIDAILHLGYIEVGLIVTEVQERQLWRFVDDENGVAYANFTAWLRAAAPRSYKTCHNAKTAVTELRMDIHESELAKMTECNIAHLMKASWKVRRDPEVVKAAQTMEEKDFVDHIIQAHPDQHFEPVVKPTLRLTAPVQDALDMIGSLMSLEGRQEQLEALCIDFVVEHQQ